MDTRMCFLWKPPLHISILYLKWAAWCTKLDFHIVFPWWSGFMMKKNYLPLCKNSWLVLISHHVLIFLIFFFFWPTQSWSDSVFLPCILVCQGCVWYAMTCIKNQPEGLTPVAVSHSWALAKCDSGYSLTKEKLLFHWTCPFFSLLPTFTS